VALAHLSVDSVGFALRKWGGAWRGTERYYSGGMGEGARAQQFPANWRLWAFSRCSSSPLEGKFDSFYIFKKKDQI
jgi:hypothetical protein